MNSPELEEYIIAGADYRRTLNIFKDEISNIDFSKLEFIENSKGEKVAHLPVSVNVEKQSRVFKEKKRTLFARYPQFASLTETARQNYFRTCIRSSPDINGKLLELGINAFLPSTKQNSEGMFTDEKDYMDFLARWIENNDDEIIIIVFDDGSATYWLYDKVSSTSTQTPPMQEENGQTSYMNRQVSKLIHTQPDNGEASDTDKKGKFAGVDHYVYYNGNLYEY